MALERIPMTLALLAVTLPLPALAQSQDGVAATVLLDPVVVRARDDDGNAADRGTSEYVADAELERARMGDLKDLFSGIASVSVGGAIPVAQKIYVNGIDMLNLAVTVDGVAQNNRIFHHVSANAFDPGLMKFVRVDAGVAAADAGPNAMAGAVVMETVDAADIIKDGRNIGGNARLSYADNGNTFGRSATLAGRHSGFEWLGYLKTATGDDYETGAGDKVQGSAADLQTYLAKLAYETEDGHRVEFSGQRMQDDALRPYRANFVGDGRPFPLRRYDTDRTTYALSYENTQANGMWDPRVTLGWSKVDIGVAQPLEPGLGTSRGLNKTFSAKVENRFHLSGTDNVTVGIDYYDRDSSYRDGSLTGDVTESAQNVGLYAQARLEPSDRLALSFGARWDHQDFTGTTGWDDTFSGFSGNASVSYAVTDSLKLRGGVSSVFGGVTLEDNFIFNPAWDYTGLKAARADNYTLGFDYEAGDLRLDGEVFLTKIADARFSTFRANDNADAESRGFNIGLGYGWADGFMRASYAYSKIKVNGEGTDTYSAVDLGAPLGGVFALEVQHTLPGSAFTLGGSIEAAQAYDDKSVDADRGIPGYAVLNLFTEYTPPAAPDLVIRAEIANLFDKEYADRATYGQDYSSVEPLYEPGRTVMVTAALKF
ncbi:TonB-dependent receptor plug domain-containing protein [Paracoccus laeviglucosivorans]|uniref:Hemoglobin/transferrin/lactoferrin receptor protein n=1 Tax=Paracoccus laeviglucosivorans TaxID=1197861 RepID=A0A521F670_9RHOB|nr:TonB-dependent receptor [Paracoccus laeviglucosivorans]SMO91708.1 hemoglobin/transferrin/lactoferrin receptor protein [Paracoccus laeviglucosivorans]